MNLNHIYRKTGIITAIILCVAVSGCKKFVEVPSPIDQIPTNEVFQSDAKAGSVVRGLYGEMVGSTGFFTSILSFSGAVQISMGVSADELMCSNSSNQFNEFYTNAISSNNGLSASSIWGGLYNVIYNANAVIQNVERSPGMTPGGKKQYLAEAKFIRAANYFYMVNMYGDIPMPTTTDYHVNANLSKVPQEEVYKLIIEDLKFAVENLDVKYIGSQRLRANKYAAEALLARVYLYQGNWADAETLATDVINAGVAVYDLEKIDLGKAFLTNSKEVILQLQQPGSNLYTWDAYNFVPNGTNIPQYQITDALFKSFESDADLRKTNWIKVQRVTTNGVPTDYPYPYKYRINSGTGTVRSESLVFLRLAEVYLIRAEARAQRSKLTDAITDLDIIRDRAGISKIQITNPNVGQTELLALIAHERYVELFAELGHRWMDLKRTGKADEVLKNKPNWRLEAKLYPIPLSDIEKNTSLKQNPGYN